MLFRRFGIVLLLAAFLGTASLAARLAVDSDEAAIPPLRGVNRIAYVTESGAVRLVRPDGTGDISVSPADGVFTWPAWSANGRWLAYSGIVSGGAGLTLMVRDVEGERDLRVFENTGPTVPVLPGMPHYTLWSPEGETLSFMASVPDGLTLFLYGPGPDGRAATVIQDAPLYVSWNAGSRSLLVHHGALHTVIDASTGLVQRSLPLFSDTYRTPAWHPDGTRFTAMTQTRAGTNQIVTIGSEDDSSQSLGVFQAGAAFGWSPNGENLAVAPNLQPGAPVYNGIDLYSQSGERQSAFTREAVIAFFWSPGGDRIAYVTPTLVRGEFRWNMLDAASGETWPLVTFVPTRDQLTILRFFDQFALSHSPWSPDGESLVFAGTLPEQGIPASVSTQITTGVYVIDADGIAPHRRIASGIMAVWSPR
jgi:Tol biopolymer transport system component